MLFADGSDIGESGPDVLLIERAADMRSHAGQPAFPGGAADPGDNGPVSTALREAQEETSLDPAGVTPVAALPQMWLPPSGICRHSCSGVVARDVRDCRGGSS